MRVSQKAKMLLAGDVVEKAAKPIARVLKLSCLDRNGKLKPQSPCGKRKAALNRWHVRLKKWLLDKWKRHPDNWITL